MTTLVMPDTTRVWGLDISHWNQPPVDLQRMKDLYGLRFVIIKGCDGAVKANYFDQHKANAKAAGLPWGVYIWLYPQNKVDIQTQVNAWYNLVVSDYPAMGVYIDCEWTTYAGAPANPTATDLRSAHDKYRAKIGKRAITYTAPGYADEYLKGFDWTKEELWIAHYGVTSPQLPIGASTYLFHQFTSHLDGQQLDPNGNAELDGNYFHGSQTEFNARFGVISIPADTITQPHPGMTRISGVRHGWEFELFITDPARVNYEVVCLSPLETVSSVAKRKGATLGVNGGEWDRMSSPKDYTVSNGTICHARVEPVPSLLIQDNETIFIDHIQHAGTQQALSGLRYLIQSGTIKAYLYGLEPQYTEGHARSIHGVTADGMHMVMQSRGVFPNQGLTLKECAEIMQPYGAVTAFDSGGGGDVTCVLDGISLIEPENINPANGQHFERPLPSVFLIYAEGDTMSDHYKIEATDSNSHTIRSNHIVTASSVGSFVKGDMLFAGVTDMDIFTYPADRYEIIGGINTLVAKAGDIWRKLFQKNGAPIDGWTAVIHKGITQALTIVLVTTTPVPITHTVDVMVDGVNVYHKDLD